MIDQPSVIAEADTSEQSGQAPAATPIAAAPAASGTLLGSRAGLLLVGGVGAAAVLGLVVTSATIRHRRPAVADDEHGSFFDDVGE